MELLPSENLLTIKALLQSLSNQLTDSNTLIASLENISKDLLGNSNIPESEEVVKQEKLTLRTDELESQLIESLEEQRLLLLMDIQKQDYVTKKLNEIIDQNLDMVDTIKEYLLNSKQAQSDELKISNLILDNYTDNIVRLADEKLQINLYDVKLNTNKIVQVLHEITSGLKENSLFNYSETLNELIKGMNVLLEKEI